MPKVTNVTFNTEREVFESSIPVSAKLALIQARRFIHVAHEGMEDGEHTWSEIEPYIASLEDAMKAFKREHKPTPFNPFRLFKGGLRR